MRVNVLDHDKEKVCFLELYVLEMAVLVVNGTVIPESLSK